MRSHRSCKKRARNGTPGVVSCPGLSWCCPEEIMSAVVSPTAVAVNTAQKSRLGSIDLVRGAVMVLMAIDHVRVFSGIPAGGPTEGVFFTRWVTNFCAPAFIFLA